MKVRHELLLDTLGYVFPKEEHSYWLMTLLMWLLPTILAVAALVDALLAYIYMRYAHPWRGILEDPAPRKVIPEASKWEILMQYTTKDKQAKVLARRSP